MPLCDIYGMTEAVPASMNLPWARKWGTVGRPAEGANIKIADNGEILTQTVCQTVGYYNDPEKTAQDLVDGWVHTGDKGEIDEDGYLKISGRIKDIFKTAKGKYVVPTVIEDKMAEHPYLEQLCLVGAGMPATMMLAVLSASAESQDVAVIEEALTAQLNAVNKTVEKHERMSHILICKAPWTVENGMLTHTMKTKRSALENEYDELTRRVSESVPDNTVIYETTFLGG